VRLRIALVVVLAAAVAATPAVAAVRVTLTTTTKAPKVGEAWRWTVTARDGTKPVAARVKLQILLGDIVVGCWKSGAMAQCAGKTAGDAISFRASARAITWPAESVGVALTFQAVVTANKRTQRLRTAVRVQASSSSSASS
jgi:hypothetical protein